MGGHGQVRKTGDGLGMLNTEEMNGPEGHAQARGPLIG